MCFLLACCCCQHFSFPSQEGRQLHVWPSGLFGQSYRRCHGSVYCWIVNRSFKVSTKAPTQWFVEESQCPRGKIGLQPRRICTTGLCQKHCVWMGACAGKLPQKACRGGIVCTVSQSGQYHKGWQSRLTPPCCPFSLQLQLVKLCHCLYGANCAQQTGPHPKCVALS